MAKNSALFNLYKERIARCKTPEELLKVSKEISKISFKLHERTALVVACALAAKWFDKHGDDPTVELLEPTDSDVTQDAAASVQDLEEILKDFNPYPEVL